MPKRIIDGEGLWRSNKIAQVQPAKFRAELANIIPLAKADGTFEADARLVWSQVYSFNRPDVMPRNVEAMLKEFERVKILFRWQAEDGKLWGYIVGVHKPGRLPPQSQRYKEAAGLAVPQDLLAAFLAGKVASPYLGPTGKVREGYEGIGIGLGLSSGSGLGKGNSNGRIGNAIDHHSNKQSLPSTTQSTIRSNTILLSTEQEDIQTNSSTIPIPSNTLLSPEQEDTQLSNKLNPSASPLRSPHPAIKRGHPEEAKNLAHLLRWLIDDNPHVEHTRDDWERYWVSDFEELLCSYPYETCRRIVRFSQMGNWQKYCIRSLPVLNNAEEMLEQMDKPKILEMLDEYDAKDLHADSLYEPAISDDPVEEEEEGWDEDSDEEPDEEALLPDKY